MKKEDPHKLTPKEAIALLSPHLEGKKKRVHSFEGTGFGLFGCDIDLTHVKRYLKEANHIALAGKNMSAVGHGLGYQEKGKGFVFLETDMDAVEKLKIERKIK